MIGNLTRIYDRRSAILALVTGRFAEDGDPGSARRGRRRHAGAQATAGLDDHVLRDIGVTRAELGAAVFGKLPRGADRDRRARPARPAHERRR